MKKVNIVFIIGIISILIGTSTSVYAVNYLYNGTQVVYDNTTSGLVSTDVQGALDEVYAATMDYATLRAQVINSIYPVGGCVLF